jgi:hypothetical protein
MKISSIIRTRKPAGEERALEASQQQRLLLQEQIWRIVSRAARNDMPLAAAPCAQRLQREFSRAGLSLLSITDALVYAAVDAGVVVEARAETVKNRRMRRVRQRAVYATSRVSPEPTLAVHL